MITRMEDVANTYGRERFCASHFGFVRPHQRMLAEAISAHATCADPLRNGLSEEEQRKGYTQVLLREDIEDWEPGASLKAGPRDPQTLCHVNSLCRRRPQKRKRFEKEAGSRRKNNQKNQKKRGGVEKKIKKKKKKKKTPKKRGTSVRQRRAGRADAVG